MLLIFAILGLLAAMRPLGVVAGGDAAPDAAGGESDDVGGLAEGEQTDAGQAGGEADPNAPPAGEFDADDAAGRAWDKVRGGQPAGGRGTPAIGPDGKPLAMGQPPVGPAAGEIQGLAKELRIAPESLAKIPAEHQAAFVGEIDRWWNQVYAPQAQKVSSWYGQLQNYTERIQEFRQSDPFQVAVVLGQDPQLFEAVLQFIQGGQGGQAGGNALAETLARINPAELDETSRALYEMNQAALQRAEMLEQQLQQFGGVLGQATNRWQQYDQQQAAKVQEMAGQLASDAMSAAEQAAAAHFGFDPNRHQAEYAKAEKYLMWRIKGEGLEPTPEALGKAWIECLNMAGFGALKNQRRQLARSAAAPPPDRAGPGGGSFDPDVAAARAWAGARATA